MESFGDKGGPLTYVNTVKQLYQDKKRKVKLEKTMSEEFT